MVLRGRQRDGCKWHSTQSWLSYTDFSSYASEVFPLKYRAKGVGLSAAVSQKHSILDAAIRRELQLQVAC